MSQRPRSTVVIADPSEIVRALVGLKDVRVLAYVCRGPWQRGSNENTNGLLRQYLPRKR